MSVFNGLVELSVMIWTVSRFLKVCKMNLCVVIIFLFSNEDPRAWTVNVKVPSDPKTFWSYWCTHDKTEIWFDNLQTMCCCNLTHKHISSHFWWHGLLSLSLLSIFHFKTHPSCFIKWFKLKLQQQPSQSVIKLEQLFWIQTQPASKTRLNG